MKLINILLIAMLLNHSSCAQEKNKTMNKIDVNSSNVFNPNKAKTGYFMQINHQNCRYDIRINDIPLSKYIDPYPAYSQRPMMNYRITKSGMQKISIRVSPFNGDTISYNADMQITVLKYADMLDKENSFGGSTEIASWSLPNIDTIVPYLYFEFEFEADVPYEINILDYAVDLSEMDEDVLLEEVASQYKEMLTLIKTDYTLYNKQYDFESLPRLMISRYYTQAYSYQICENNKQIFQDPEYRPYLQDIENYKLQLYGNGKIATLERLSDGGRIIWCKSPKTGTEIASLPLNIYKDKRDMQWHVW